MITETELVESEKNFEMAKAERMDAKLRLEAARAKLHLDLIKRRDLGENLTIADMKAIKDAAIVNPGEVRDFYEAFQAVDMKYRVAKLDWEHCKRSYWDQKPQKI